MLFSYEGGVRSFKRGPQLKSFIPHVEEDEEKKNYGALADCVTSAI